MGEPDDKISTSDEARRTGFDAPPNNWVRALQDLLSALLTLIKIVGIASVLLWAYFNRDFIKEWLWGVSGVEVVGWKLQHEAMDKATAELTEYSREVASCQPNQDGYCLDKALANDAIIRASRVAPAIVDGRILWVDDKPQNNRRIKNILERMGIQVVLRNSTQDALNVLKIAPFAAVITNVWRPNDPDHLKNELTVCRVHYFDFPRGLDTTKYFSDRALWLSRERPPSGGHRPARLDGASVYASPGRTSRDDRRLRA